MNFRPKIFFFMEIARILRKICYFLSEDVFFTRTLPRFVLGILASRGSVLGRCVLGFGFFLCVLGLESCVLDSTSGDFIAKIEA